MVTGRKLVGCLFDCAWVCFRLLHEGPRSGPVSVTFERGFQLSRRPEQVLKRPWRKSFAQILLMAKFDLTSLYA